MAIYRLSIEVLKGKRDSNSDEEVQAAQGALAALRDQVRGIDGMVTYGEEDIAPWGVPMREHTFNLDLDSELHAEDPVDTVALMQVVAFFNGAP